MKNPQSGTLAFLFAMFRALHLVSTRYYVQRAHTDWLIIMMFLKKKSLVVCYFQGINSICLDIYSDQDKIYSAICKLDVYGEGDPVSGGGGLGLQLRIISRFVSGAKKN